MGQYRQWLHYRHVDQQLQAQKQRLVTKLTHLQEHIHSLNAPLLESDNAVVLALTLYARTLSASSQKSVVEQAPENGHVQQPKTFSQALFDHSRLSNVEPMLTKDTYESTLSKHPTNPYAPLPPIPHKAIDLVPDENAQTEPQIALPWWLRNAALSATREDTLDAQSIRTNRLVQRWLERWGRQEEQTGQSPQANGKQTST
ncbi:MAG: hypothetical protein NVSMB49_05560 [Ktedonobacteraceae bacterium]